MTPSDGLFCPPDGAMQFEVERDALGRPLPERLKPYVLWVMPAVTKGPRRDGVEHVCGSSQMYPIVAAIYGGFVDRVDPGTHVCACAGRIVE